MGFLCLFRIQGANFGLACFATKNLRRKILRPTCGLLGIGATFHSPWATRCRPTLAPKRGSLNVFRSRQTLHPKVGAMKFCANCQKTKIRPMVVGHRRKIKIRPLVVGRRRASLLRLSRRAVVPRCARNGISVDHNWQVGGAQKRTCKVRRLPRRLANISPQVLAFFPALGNIRSAKPTPPICLRLGVS